MKIGIVVFPGSNCDRDCLRAVKNVTGASVFFLWHKETTLKGADAVILPGGFSYGDYLRCGAIAKFSPVMREVIVAAEKGMPVLGICNGFQILTEAGLLPGVLMRNRSLHFICKDVFVRLENTKTAFTRKGRKNKAYRIPIAHMEGCYFISAEGLKGLEDNNQIVFRYVDAKGNATREANPNGSVENIAGITNTKGNVVGLMPHPERVCEEVLNGTDGRFFFESLG
ncbi:MAG: phosphoribosylformylglycinamidine synthase subunit PurQ [Deltaproteobacteria bacterium]|nr:phosphoribosylformylglycinamidine synthase subunit PurQ [Deltaproteobacteria bacterium]